ncbi:MAG: hypothetical protein ALECFALPRED_001339 [Alectoria fallacina]|uniref:Uncharacterized protein n=1 Tax=Alectoria fallacina TaxID=1903189 RepID=A0A8H3JAW4_9LECA|nr:MAG: hypothetical protein ALECFALPRED_001339 [Alectoria fallacina]
MYTLTLLTPLFLTLTARTLGQTPPPSNMTITVYSGLNCNPNGTSFTLPLPYNVQETNFDNDSMPFLSYSLSRATTLQEQLDISGPTKGMGSLDGNPQQCTLFHETTSPDSNGNPLMANHCYGLLLGPAECLRFLQRN